MRLHCILLMIVATLAAKNDVVSAVRVTEDAQLWKAADADQVNSVNTVHVETRRKRFLRTGETHNADYVYDPTKREVFIEDKLQKALTNPKKTKKLYERWYKSGYSVKKVASGLNQDENRELDDAYEELVKEYAVYIKEKRT